MKGNSLLRWAAAASLTPLGLAGILPQDVKVERPRAAAINPNAVAVTKNYTPLRTVVAPHSDGLRRVKRYQAAWNDAPKPGTSSVSNSNDIYYLVDMTIGNQTLALHLDTGSSDTWVVQQPVTCVDMGGFRRPAAKCGFSEGFKGSFSQGTLPNRTFVRSYTDGTFVTGSFGFEDVTIGGITVAHQQLAVVNYTYWWGDGLTAGLLGLAYPLMTGMDGDDDPSHEYDPLFTSMWKQERSSPLFSLALSREQANNPTAEEKGSYLAFGGIPPVDFDDSSWSRTPIQLLQTLKSWWFVNSTENGLYVITPDAWVLGKPGAKGEKAPEPTALKNTYPVLIDAGATLSILPKKMVETLYSLFDPPATYLSEQGIFFAPCNATAPLFGVQIGSQVYYVSPEDLLRQGARDSTGTKCRVGITDHDDGPHVLGITFLANVVAVFDVGNGEMRFAARNKY